MIRPLVHNSITRARPLRRPHHRRDLAFHRRGDADRRGEGGARWREAALPNIRGLQAPGEASEGGARKKLRRKQTERRLKTESRSHDIGSGARHRPDGSGRHRSEPVGRRSGTTAPISREPRTSEPAVAAHGGHDTRRPAAYGRRHSRRRGGPRVDGLPSGCRGAAFRSLARTPFRTGPRSSGPESRQNGTTDRPYRSRMKRAGIQAAPESVRLEFPWARAINRYCRVKSASYRPTILFLSDSRDLRDDYRSRRTAGAYGLSRAVRSCGPSRRLLHRAPRARTRRCHGRKCLPGAAPAPASRPSSRS